MKKPKQSKRLTTSSIVRAIRMKAPVRSKKSAQAKRWWPAATSPAAMVAAGISVFVVVLLIVMWPSSHQGGDALAAAQSAGPETGSVRAPMRSDPKRATTSNTPASVMPSARVANAPGRLPGADSIPADTEPAPDARAMTAVARDVSQLAPVTITGCLERSDEIFRLKDTDGADAPKARSWRSGFLKKRAATVALVDSAHQFRLPSFVGQRIAATGTIENREMQVQSVQRVAVSCS